MKRILTLIALMLAGLLADHSPCVAGKLEPSVPDKIPGLTLWLSASGLHSREHAKVLQWSDSRRHIEFTPLPPRRRPTYEAHALHGQPAVRFKGQELLSSTPIAGSQLFGSDQFTIALVGEQNTSQVESDLFGWGNCLSDVLFARLYRGTNYRVIAGKPEDSVFDQAFPFRWVGSPHVLVIVRDGANVFADVDGVSTVKAEGTGKMRSDLDLRNVSPLFIGNSGCTASLDGYLSEFVVYDRALDKGALDSLVNYFLKKYRIRHG